MRRAYMATYEATRYLLSTVGISYPASLLKAGLSRRPRQNAHNALTYLPGLLICPLGAEPGSALQFGFGMFRPTSVLSMG